MYPIVFHPSSCLRYLLRTNLTSTVPAQLWLFYLQLTEVEAAFRDIKGDLSIRPIFHPLRCCIAQSDSERKACVVCVYVDGGRPVSAAALVRMRAAAAQRQPVESQAYPGAAHPATCGTPPQGATDRIWFTSSQSD
jgi:hypothetical protein